MTVATLTEELRTRYELGPDVKGVVIVEVLEGSPAARGDACAPAT